MALIEDMESVGIVEENEPKPIQAIMRAAIKLAQGRGRRNV